MTTRVDDPTFAAHPRALQHRIDNAFRRAIGKTSSRKRRKLNDNGLYERNSPGGFIPSDPNALEGGFVLDEPETGSGFIVDYDDDGGGFVPEPSPPRAGPSISTIPADHDSEARGEESSPDSDSYIPLSLIPTALQILDLPPDDDQVLLVFKNAASGWTSGPASARRTTRAAGPTEEAVSLRDWRAVCSVLLEPDAQAAGVDEEDDRMDQDNDARMSDGLVEDSGGSSEEYVESDPGSNSDDPDPGDDNYSDIPAKRSTRSTRRKSGRTNKGFDESDEEDVEIKKNRPLTARQKEASRQAFALFFPSSVDVDLEKQRITISDLVRVSKELNEKITYDQVRRFHWYFGTHWSLTASLVQMVEMLSFISTSQDKMSVSLADFGRMMVDTKLA